MAATYKGTGDADGDGIFDPTVFEPGAHPGISAEQLNKLGGGIRDAQILAAAAVIASRQSARTASFLTMGV